MKFHFTLSKPVSLCFNISMQSAIDVMDVFLAVSSLSLYRRVPAEIVTECVLELEASVDGSTCYGQVGKCLAQVNKCELCELHSSIILV